MKVASDTCKQGRLQCQNHTRGHARIPQSEGVLVSGSGYSCTTAAVTLHMGSATSKTMAKGPIGLPQILQEPLDPFGG